MTKFRKKPVTVDAVKWTGENFGEVVDIWNAAKDHRQKGSGVEIKTPGLLEIRTLEGTLLADIGDYIICGVHGELYPCKSDIFAATYEPITE